MGIWRRKKKEEEEEEEKEEDEKQEDTWQSLVYLIHTTECLNKHQHAHSASTGSWSLQLRYQGQVIIKLSYLPHMKP